jgi:hypothetical protein
MYLFRPFAVEGLNLQKQDLCDYTYVALRDHPARLDLDLPEDSTSG